ncbi:MAG: CDP-alcohol phosphatidyltransferase family protein [Candidatus Geothermarchaeales archaeon]
MVLDSYRKAADRVLTPVASRIHRLSPNIISWISLLAAGLTGAFVFLSGHIDSVLALSLALVALVVSSFFDALDGKVARLRGIDSKRGDFLDHVFDRYSDVFIIVGLFFSIYTRQWVALFGLLGILLTSYMGTQAQAVGVGRIYGGVLGRADRLVILLLVITLHLALDPSATMLLGYRDLSFTMMEYALLLFGVLGNLTAIQRAVATWRHL